MMHDNMLGYNFWALPYAAAGRQNRAASSVPFLLEALPLLDEPASLRLSFPPPTRHEAPDSHEPCCRSLTYSRCRLWSGAECPQGYQLIRKLGTRACSDGICPINRVCKPHAIAHPCGHLQHHVSDSPVAYICLQNRRRVELKKPLVPCH